MSQEMHPEIRFLPEGRLIILKESDDQDLEFIREVYGYDAESRGWWREDDRLFILAGVLSEREAREKLNGPVPSSILEVDEDRPPDGPPKQHFLTMDDGTEVSWISHPSALPERCRTTRRLAHTCSRLV